MTVTLEAPRLCGRSGCRAEAAAAATRTARVHAGIAATRTRFMAGLLRLSGRRLGYPSCAVASSSASHSARTAGWLAGGWEHLHVRPHTGSSRPGARRVLDGEARGQQPFSQGGQPAPRAPAKFAEWCIASSHSFRYLSAHRVRRAPLCQAGEGEAGHMRVVLRYGADRRAVRAFRARQELVKAGLTRRDLARMGLLTGGGVAGGLLTAEKGMARALRSPSALGAMPSLQPFVEALPVLPALPPLRNGAADLTPAPTDDPNVAPNPGNGNLPFEGRTEKHQSRDRFPVRQYFLTRMGANTAVRIHPQLPLQTLWGFNRGGTLASDPPISPGPVLVMRYGSPVLVRRTNELPPPNQNGGFGVPEGSTHLHNFHSGPDSDGGPCDPKQQRFFFRGQYYDYFYNLQRAGWGSTNPPNGDVRETLGFLWYHDHRVDHTAENTYKGLVGPAIIFNEFDTGNENTGFRLPSFPNFDIPLVFAD